MLRTTAEHRPASLADPSSPVDPATPAAGPKALAADLVNLMRTLGFDCFAVVGHDRGARVASACRYSVIPPSCARQGRPRLLCGDAKLPALLRGGGRLIGRAAAAVVAVSAAALVLAASAREAAPKPSPVPRATTARDGTVLIGGLRHFLIGVGWPTPEAASRALTLGIRIFQENGPGATQLAISQAVGRKGYVVPGYSLKNLHEHYPNAIGYSLADEPDGNRLLPATADPDAGERLPFTERAAKTGVLIMQTLTSHFMSSRPKWDGIGDAEYRAYIANADVVLTALYPFAHGCAAADPGVSLSMVYDAMVELKRLAPSKAVGEWIETGAIEGYCGPDPVTPEAAHAEAWAAVAGGAQSLFWFTHTFSKGYWDDFDVSPQMADTIAATNAELLRYSPVILAQRVASAVSAPEDPIKVGVRYFRGRLYLIAVNLSASPVDLTQDAAAEQWWPKLPGLSSQNVSELTTGWTGRALAGRIADTIPAFGLRIYSWSPREGLTPVRPLGCFGKR